jgi:homopolymeric O-antigen transport system permease protein
MTTYSISPYSAHSVSPATYVGTVIRHRELIARLVGREFALRFRGSFLGVLWAIMTPVLTVIVYAFVFGVVFNSKWGEATKSDFVSILMLGIIVHGMFAEAIARAPSLILGHANYVKKVIFPLEVLPVMAVVGVLMNAAIGVLIVIGLNLILSHELQPTIVFLPLILLPYLVLIIGFVLFLSAIGVYLRDLTHLVGFFVMVSLFMTPIFYPISAVPEGFRPFLYLNPLTFAVEQARAVTLFGMMPNWTGLAIYSVIAVICAWFGLYWFQRTRNGFADVI